MKKCKLIFSLVLAVCLTLGMTAAVFAESYDTGDRDWHVKFTNDKKMEQNFSTADFADTLKGFQPGDDATLQIRIENDYSKDTNWYMENKILKSLESMSNAEGGTYTYKLVYNEGMSDENVIFNSERVGGENSSAGKDKGLSQATKALGDWFYLDSLKPGETGMVRLKIAFDGESQTNNYQKTFAQIQMNFAAEEAIAVNATKKASEPSRAASGRVIKTGDSTNMTLWMILAILSLSAIVGILVAGRKKKEEQ